MDHPTLQLPLAFDLIATFVSALAGAMLAAKRKYDFVGAFALAFVTGLGGALIRDGVFLQNDGAAAGECGVVVHQLCDQRPRRSLVSHCMSADARFHPTAKSAIYSRYQRVGDDRMDESFFPVLWREDGYRTPWLDAYMRTS